MKTIASAALAAALSFALTAPPAQADEHGKGKGKGKFEERDRYEERRDDGRRDEVRRDDMRRGDEVHRDRQFYGRDREVVRNYYVEEHRSGRCPPGLAKKHDGCMPPGLAKKWAVGRPLPREVVYYDVPPQLVVQIGLPPPGHKYVRAAGDILLIAVATGLVVDAIEDLGR
jgi:Ni/Co efflux regulator RcnB